MATLNIVQGAISGQFILSENIDEYMDLSVLKECPEQKLIFNMKGIQRITSMGIKKWSMGMRAILEQGKQVRIEESAEVVTQTCNIWPAFIEGADLHSFEVSFYCEDCDEVEVRMLKRVDLGKSVDVPSVPCPECRIDMDLEEEGALDFLLE